MAKKPKLSIKEKEARRPKSLRITGLGAPARQLMSESGRMRLEARKQRRAGNMEGYKELMLRASMERLAGEPNVKSQAFVDAQEKAKANQPDIAARMQAMMTEFMRNRRRPEGEGDVQDFEDLPEIRPREQGPLRRYRPPRMYQGGPQTNPYTGEIHGGPMRMY